MTEGADGTAKVLQAQGTFLLDKRPITLSHVGLMLAFAVCFLVSVLAPAFTITHMKSYICTAKSKDSPGESIKPVQSC